MNHPGSRAPRLVPGIVVAAFLVPFLALIVQAAADRWHGRALVPQEVGARGVRAVLDDPTIVDAIAGSLGVAAIVSVLAVVIAWPAARYLAVSRSVTGWAVLAAPVLLPPLLLGDGLSAWLLDLGFGGGHVGVAIAHSAVAIPYAALALVPAFGADLDELEQTSALLGASVRQRLASVVAPAARRHVALAFALAFTVSWSQYATSLAVGGGTPMLPLVLVPYVRSDPQIGATLTLLFMVPPALALVVASRVGGPARGRAPRRSTASIAMPSASN